MAEAPEPPRKKLNLTQAEFTAVNEPVAPGSTSGNEPLELLRANRQHEIEHGTAPEPDPSKPRSFRHVRDYVLLLAVVDVPLGFILYLSGDPFSYVLALAGLAMYTAALTWVMFVVLDKPPRGG